MSVIVHQLIEIICFETTRNIHMALLRGMVSNLNNNERATTQWSKVIFGSDMYIYILCVTSIKLHSVIQIDIDAINEFKQTHLVKMRK